MIILLLVVVILVLIYFFKKPKIRFKPYSIKGYSDLKVDNYGFTKGGIPKIIIKTSWHKREKMPEQLIDAIKSSISMNPEYNIYYFDNDEVDLFMKEFSQQVEFKNVYEFYKTLVPGAFKADFFRDHLTNG
jgi:mannosyltransferase OCH1-like enzyme